MDIAKIRKKALSKKAEQRPEEKTPVPPSEEEEKKEPEEGPAPEEPDVPQGEVPAEETPAGDEGQGSPGGDEDTAAEKTEEMVELITFSISREEFAFGVPEVEEIMRLHTITRVPDLPDYVLGVTSLRGKIIPVIDLKARLNLGKPPAAAGSPPGTRETGKGGEAARKILIIEGPKGLIGAAIDKVTGVMRLPANEILEPPGHLSEDERKFLKGIAVRDKRFISVIRADAAMDIVTG